MKQKISKSVLLIFMGLVVMSSCSLQTDNRYPYRWVRASSRLAEDEQVKRLKQIILTASQHELNGILLSCGADQLDLRSDDFIRRLRDLKAFCDERDFEIIPNIFGIGYGGSTLAHNRNLAAGLPVEGALFLVKGNEAIFVPDSPRGLRNGSFEKNDGSRADGFDYPENQTDGTFIDMEVAKDGGCSLRFEVKTAEEGRTVVSQVFEVTPHRTYRVSAWIKSEGMDPARPFGSGNVRIKAYAAEDDRQLEWININAPSGVDWFKVDLGFNSLEYDQVRLDLGPSGETVGKFWIDGLAVEEVALVNVLRRPGTPLRVTSDKDGTEYEEGKDFEPIADPNLDFRWAHTGPTIKLIQGGRIKDRERLRVSYYHGTHVYNGQTTICMSEPQVYEIWTNNARLMKEKIGFTNYFLHTDEVRAGGTCAACKARNLPMKEILGDCVAKAYQIIRELNPEAQIFTWSDMFDPNHNASKRRGYYFHVPEVFYGSWEYLPKDMVIACWNYRVRDESLKHFSQLGFRTMAAAYYDADDLENPKGWLESMSRTPGASGIIYTTWLRKYELLGNFGDLVAKQERPSF